MRSFSKQLACWGLLASCWTAAFADPVITNVAGDAWTGTTDCRKAEKDQFVRPSGAVVPRTIGNCYWLPGGSPRGYAVEGNLTLTSPTSGISTVDDPLRGTATAWGGASNSSYLPELHAIATSKAGAVSSGHSTGAGVTPGVYSSDWYGVADANIWIVQAYKYTGLTPYHLMVSGSFDSIFSVSGQDGKLAHSSFGVSIFGAAGYDPDEDGSCVLVGTCAAGSGNSLVPVYAKTGWQFLYDTGARSFTLDAWIDPGQEFLVGAAMDASACCGVEVDTSHTLKMVFGSSLDSPDTTLLSQLESIAVPGTVPEPGSATLLLTGGLALAWVRRRALRN